MGNNIVNEFIKSKDGSPAGGFTHAIGIAVNWQNGPVVSENGQNGAFVEDVLTVAKKRLEFFQDSKFNCIYNKVAIDNINTALAALDDRTTNRKARGVEGTYKE